MKTKTDEIWDRIVVDGKRHEWYSISTHGNLVSHLKNKSRGSKGFDRGYDPNVWRPMRFSKKTNPDGTTKKLYAKLSFPNTFFEDYDYKVSRGINENVLREVSAHQLVMWTFKPIDKFPPSRLITEWHTYPESAKQWMRETAYINHIDHLPENNHLDNLEYVTPRENSRKAVKFYDGNINNKSKFISVINSKEPEDEIEILNPLAAFLAHV